MFRCYLEGARMKKLLLILTFILCCCPICSLAAWYDSELSELQEQNFINAVHFQNPDNPILREEICDILISLYKYQNPDKEIENKANSFTDIQNSAFKTSIENAYSLGIIQGVSNTEFHGQGTLTREQFATIIYRMHGSPMSAVRLYRDEPEISDYAISAIDYCIQQGIVKGTQKDFFSPKKSLTKAEALAIVNRLVKKEENLSENVQITTNLIEEKEKVYMAIVPSRFNPSPDNGIVIIDKLTEKRTWIPLSKQIEGHLFDLGDFILIPTSQEDDPSYPSYHGAYALDKQSATITEYELPELSNVWAFYNNGIYCTVYENNVVKIARYDLDTKKVTSGAEVNMSYFWEERVAYGKKDKVYFYLRSYENKSANKVDAATVNIIDLNDLTIQTIAYPQVREFDFITDKYTGYSEYIDNGGTNWEHNIIICDTNSGNQIKKVNVKEFLNTLPYNNDKINNRYLKQTSVDFEAICVNDEIYITDQDRRRLVCITNPDLFDICLGNKYDFVRSLMGKEETEYFQLNNDRTYSVSKDASYSSIYNRKFFEGNQPLSEECKKELQLLRVQKDYWCSYHNKYDLVNAVNYYLTYCCEYDYVARDNRSNPAYSKAFSVFGVIENQKAVCNGYAEYFDYVLKYSGIPGKLLTGSDHAWNVIYLDGKYYYFDCTNNASFGDENAFAWKNKEEMLFSPESQYDPYLP